MWTQYNILLHFNRNPKSKFTLQNYSIAENEILELPENQVLITLDDMCHIAYAWWMLSSG